MAEAEVKCRGSSTTDPADIDIEESFEEQGERKTYARLSDREWTFLVLSVTNILVTMVMSLCCLVFVASNDPRTTDLAVEIILIVSGGFCLYYTIFGLRRKLKYEIYALVGALLVLLLYSILSYAVQEDEHDTLKTEKLLHQKRLLGLTRCSILTYSSR